MKRLIIVGSPRTSGRSAHLAEMLFEANIDERPEDELFLVPVSEVEIGPCIACNACREKLPVTFKDDAGEEVTELRHRCVFDDDMQTLYDLIEDADEIIVVSPIFFSGAPSQMKCVLDRLQPYFWRRLENRQAGALPEKRPLTLHVVGEGGDPYGYAALASEVKSAFALADFRLERILDWVGKISPEGEILSEAEEQHPDDILQPHRSGPHHVQPHHVQPHHAGPAEAGLSSQSEGEGGGQKSRPKLDLSSGKPGSRSPSGGKASPSSPSGGKPGSRSSLAGKSSPNSSSGGKLGTKHQRNRKQSSQSKRRKGGSRGR